MSDQVKISLVHDDDFLASAAGDIVCRVEVLDSKLIGHDAVISIIAKFEVHDRRAVNDQNTVYSKKFKLSQNSVEIRIPRDEMRAYTYSGKMISTTLHTRLVVDDSILFDTKITEEQELKLGTKPSVSTNAKSIIEPADSFSFFKNLKAIPAEARLLTIIALVAGLVVIAVNSVIGFHDQNGDGSGPLVNSLVVSGGIGLAIWLFMRRQLRRYMKFSLKKLPQILRGRSYPLGSLVRGRSRTPLHDITLRVVACNMELGQYRRGSGTSVRTVSFREPTRGVILYKTKVKHIPPNVPIAPYFGGSVDFEPMFAALYPPFKALTHGLEVHWEVQLLHPEFVDQELVGPTDKFRYADFLEG